MQTIEAEKVQLSDADQQDERHHLVHLECHRGADPRPEFVTAMCGFVLDWDEQDNERESQPCVECNETLRCPICKTIIWRKWVGG